jgi:uncharacterized protein (DUF1015 family)
MYNQFPSMVNVSSTKETEPMIINERFYKFYPKIRQSDILTNTSNRFVDTLNISNVYLPSIGGDYDGDQTSCKSVFSIEANEELKQQINSKKHYISLSGQPILSSSNEGMDSLYALTMCLSDDESKITKNIEF